MKALEFGLSPALGIAGLLKKKKSTPAPASSAPVGPSPSNPGAMPSNPAPLG